MNPFIRFTSIWKGVLMASLLLFLFAGNNFSANPDTLYSVTFRVNMSRAVSEHIFQPDSDLVYLMMDHSIGAVQLVQGANYIYSVTLDNQLDSGVTYLYKFSINYAPQETGTRSMTASAGGMVLSCWWNNQSLNETTYQVNMKYAIQQHLFNPATDSVMIFGTVDNTPVMRKMLRLDTSLIYSFTDNLTPGGSVVQYKYRINQGDTASGQIELVNKPNRMLRVPDTIFTAASDFNNYNPAKRSMTFNCNMGYYIKAHHFDQASDFLDVAGNFNTGNVTTALFDINNDSIYSAELQLDTTWITHGPLTFKFRINGEWSGAELIGQPDRSYNFHDTVGLNPNNYNCFFNNLDPSVPTPPWAYNVAVQGLSIYKKFMSGTYGYENVNGIPEGISTYRWLRSSNAQGTDAVAIDSATKITYTVDTVDIGKWIVFEVTPKAVSGDSAVGKPVRAISSQISAWDVGMSENESLIARVYPNPCTDQITIVSKKEITVIELFNTLNQSKTLWSGTGETKVRMELPELSPGLYFIKVTTRSGQTGTAKILHQ